LRKSRKAQTHKDQSIKYVRHCNSYIIISISINTTA
jgi:hypothetical protein